MFAESHISTTTAKWRAKTGWYIKKYFRANQELIKMNKWLPLDFKAKIIQKGLIILPTVYCQQSQSQLLSIKCQRFPIFVYLFYCILLSVLCGVDSDDYYYLSISWSCKSKNIIVAITNIQQANGSCKMNKFRSIAKCINVLRSYSGFDKVIAYRNVVASIVFS